MRGGLNVAATPTSCCGGNKNSTDNLLGGTKAKTGGNMTEGRWQKKQEEREGKKGGSRKAALSRAVFPGPSTGTRELGAL